MNHTSQYFFQNNPLKPYNRIGRDEIGRFKAYEIFQSSAVVRNLCKLYKQLSIKPNLETNFVYYSLHLEPEASIMPRNILNNQLYIIKMIADSLPKGYKLYVKEHPHQFFIYERHRYFLKNIAYFRNPLFYYQIKQLPNVVLIDINTSSLDLIKNAKAVASIAGSALVEAVVYKKPLLNFGDKINFVELLKDCFNIRSKEDIKSALDNIERGFTPNYEDLEEVCNSYCFELDYNNVQVQKDFFSKFFQKIFSSLE